MVRTVTYSRYDWLDLRRLWDSGYDNKGGLVLYEMQETEKIQEAEV